VFRQGGGTTIPSLRHGAQRASTRGPLKAALVLAFAALFAAGGLAATPAPVEAAGKKVVIVVGPTHSQTASYIDRAKRLASQARSYGATVYEVYSPNATWAKVKQVAQGANVLIYLGHGNGHPSPYGSFNQYTKDGMGLNATAGNGHNNTKYYGEYYIRNYLRLATHAVVILNHLCYASGNSEPGYANPTKSVAIQRVDNYGFGFLRTNARIVFAEGLSSTSYVLYGLFKTDRTMAQIFWSASSATKSYSFSFTSSRTPWYKALMDPYQPGKYYRSAIGALEMTAPTMRGRGRRGGGRRPDRRAVRRTRRGLRRRGSRGRARGGAAGPGRGRSSPPAGTWSARTSTRLLPGPVSRRRSPLQAPP
jgi:hypothetical protein